MVKIPWFSLAAEALNRLPLERLLLRPRDTSKDREELKTIFKDMESKGSEHPAPPTETPKVELKTMSHEGPTTEETVAYQNMEIGKALFQMEKHFAQKIKIFGKPCDCGMKTLGLGIVGDAEETIPMVSNPEIYYRLIEWAKEVIPKSTLEASASGLYDNEYPALSRQAREFRKEIVGTLDVAALFPPKTGTSEMPDILPVVSEEEKEQIRKLAHEKIDQVIE
jgi:hypothetical protein